MITLLQHGDPSAWAVSAYFGLLIAVRVTTRAKRRRR